MMWPPLTTKTNTAIASRFEQLHELTACAWRRAAGRPSCVRLWRSAANGELGGRAWRYG